MRINLSPDEVNIYQVLKTNSIVFFKDFINRIVENDNGEDDLISSELVILSVTSLQISLELALKAIAIKKSGLSSILKPQDTGKPHTELFAKFLENKLQTKKFEHIKQFVKDNNLIHSLDEYDFDTITEFQRYRNGIVHFSFKFQEGDFYDLKYDITYFVVSILIKVLCSGDDDIKPSEFLAYSLGDKYHNKLISYKPYIQAMQTMANSHSEKVFSCFHCSNEAYSIEEQYCYCCNFNGDTQAFRDCEFCNEDNCMIYDGLNLEFNDYTSNAKCINCNAETSVFVCPVCENSYNLKLVDSDKICSLDKCLN